MIIFTTTIYSKINTLLIFIIIFSFIYCFFDNSHFGGFMKMLDSKYNKNELKRLFIFNQYSKNKKYLYIEDFLKINIVKNNNNVIITNNDKLDIKLRLVEKKMLFYVFSNNNLYLTNKEFIKIPFIVDMKLHLKQKDFFKNNILLYYFYRLYYSLNIQSLLGSADIYPASNSIRVIVIIQVIITLFIIIN